MGGVHCCCRYCICGGNESAAGPGHAKTPPQGGGKTVPRPSPGAAPAEGEETSGSRNETCLVAAGQPGWAVAGLAAAASQTARCGICVHASLQAVDRDDLVPQPNSDGEGTGSPVQDSVGAVVRALEKRDDAASARPEKGGTEEVSWQLLRHQATRIMLARERKSRNIQSFPKICINVVNRNFFSMQKLTWRDNWSFKNCLSRGKTSVFPGLRKVRGVPRVTPRPKLPQRCKHGAHP